MGVGFMALRMEAGAFGIGSLVSGWDLVRFWALVPQIPLPRPPLGANSGSSAPGHNEDFPRILLVNDTGFSAESVSLDDENREASIPAVLARGGPHPVPGESSAPAAPLVHAVLLS